MKRTPLTRKTPLNRGAPLKRSPPERPEDTTKIFALSSSLKRSTPMKKASKKAPSRMANDALARVICLYTARGQCAARGILDGSCGGQLEWAHIISRRIIRLRWRSDNALCLCSNHHAALHNQAELISKLYGDIALSTLKMLANSGDRADDDFVEQEHIRLLKQAKELGVA